jgi:tRNA A-37 threonylcarbamoyl transferase component Bud32
VEKDRPESNPNEAELLSSAMQGQRVMNGRYLIGEAIGRGGAATVYTATDRLLGREVALKVFRASGDTAEHLEEQMAEARLLARFSHYALTTLLDAGVETKSGPPRILLVMEKIAGSDLRQRLRSRPMTPLQVAYLGLDLSEGLHYVHEHGYLHRDIKPANILLGPERRTDRPRAKLADFGIASIVGTPQGEFTTGTAAYLAPEQVEGDDAVPASDVYALGLVLLEALTAKVAFPGTVLESAFSRLARDAAIPDHIPAGMRSALEGMLRRRPSERISLPDAGTTFQNVLVSELLRTQTVDPALLAAHEGERVAAVHRYDILADTPDEAFDRTARLAARVVRAPMAFVSVVDAEHKTIRAVHGLPEHLAPVLRSDALCAIPISTGKPIAIDGVHVDPRTAQNPIVRAHPELRSYAGVPLVTHDGHAIGAVGVLDAESRDFTEDELADLTELAAALMRELELRRAARRALFRQ